MYVYMYIHVAYEPDMAAVCKNTRGREWARPDDSSVMEGRVCSPIDCEPAAFSVLVCLLELSYIHTHTEEDMHATLAN